MIPYRKHRFLILFFVFAGGALLFLLGSLLFLRRCEQNQVKNFEGRIASYAIAGEMRQSSDDLTKMVRLYVLTGNPQFVDFYHEILSIRNGTSPRPFDYDEIYWDFILDPAKRPRPYGPALSLQKLMILRGFSGEETALLEESLKRSDLLTQQEEEAIHAMQGRFNNGSGSYSVEGAPNPELARRLVSDREYLEQKARIMEPLYTFEKKVEERTRLETEALAKEADRVIVVSISATIFAVFAMILCLVKSMKSLSLAFETNQHLLVNMLPAGLTERLRKGEESLVDEYEASVIFVRISHFGESLSSENSEHPVPDFEDLIQKFGVEKIESVGDRQVIVAGIPVSRSDHEIALADFALALQQRVETRSRSEGLNLRFRAGMASGNVIAGVVAHKKFVYDLKGDVVNLASLLESSSEPGRILIPEASARALESLFEVEEVGSIRLPEGGSLQSYWLKKRKLEKHFFS